jgi:nitroreductase
MKITEAIVRRRSVRTYTGEALDEATALKIEEYIAAADAPFGATCRIELVRTAAAAESVRLGTYGAIRGASDYLALILRNDHPLAREGAAYRFEQVILYCTSLGLGTCWLAGFLDRGNFKKQLSLGPDEKLRVVSPVGIAADKPHRSLSTLLNGGKPTPRKPFSAGFFHKNFGDPLTEAAAGPCALPLEMVRRAPSANNKQSWRVVMDDGALHFYKTSSFGYESLDLGIALCHFEQTCLELGLEGRYRVLENAPDGQQADYVVSWTTAP